MLLGTRSKLHMPIDIVSYNGSNTEKVVDSNYLGVKLDPQLTLSNHVNYLKGKPIGIIKYLIS